MIYSKFNPKLTLIELIFAISLSNFIVKHHVGIPYENVLKTLHHTDAHKCLPQIIKELAVDTALHKHITTVLSNKFPKSWYGYIMVAHVGNRYYERHLLFFDIISNSVRDKKYWENWCLGGDIDFGLGQTPYFLMVMEHPMCYYQAHFSAFSDIKDGIQVLRDHGYTHEEKSMAIFGMSQLGVFHSYESSDYMPS